MKTLIKLSLLLALFNLNYICAIHKDAVPAVIEKFKADKEKRKSVGKNEDGKKDVFPLIDAILDRDVVKVKQLVDENNVNTLAGVEFFNEDCNKLKNKVVLTEVKNITGFCIIQSPLSVAILNSSLDKDDAEKEKSLQIIKELLNRKACPNDLVICQMFINNSHMVAFEAVSSVPFAAIEQHCYPEILDLLFAYGLCPYTRMPYDAISLLDFAKFVKADELARIIDSELAKCDDSCDSCDYYDDCCDSCDDCCDDCDDCCVSERGC